MKHLKGKIALVTGASRGVGRGIALGLGEAGATVYVTGRSKKVNKDLPGTVQQTAELITEMGGEGIALLCDHRNDEEVNKVFKKIETQHNKLDILVNNVWGGYEVMFDEQGEYIWEKPFWQQPLKQWDLMFSSSVRAHYVSSHHAAKLMTKAKSGLIVNISFWSAQKFVANVTYGVSKAATDKLTYDTAQNLKPFNVSVVSLYPGLVRTERVLKLAEYLDLGNSESPQFLGRIVSALAKDPQIIKKTGTVQIAAELGIEYGVRDIDGKQPNPLNIDDV